MFKSLWISMILRVHCAEDLEHGEVLYFVTVLLGSIECEERKTMTGLLRDLAATFSAALGRVDPG
jgi:predicted metal-dependent hydrolase